MLRWYSKLVVAAILLLIFFGALVKSHEAGLSVPDWPTSYGENMFLFPPSKWIGGIFYEHVHRLLASGIGLLTIVLTIAVWRTDRRPWMRALSVVALAMVIVQGVLGGLTVIYKLPDLISVAHGVLAQTFLLVATALAYGASSEHVERSRTYIKNGLLPIFDMSSRTLPASQPRSLARAALVVVLLVYLQLVLGAVMRHAEAGMALRDFPTMGGALLPTIDDHFVVTENTARAALGLSQVTSSQILLHIAHRLMGVLVFAAVLFLWFCGRRLVSESQRRHLTALAGVVALQFAVGAATVLSGRMPYVASIHVLLGAVTLGTAFLFVLRIYPISGRGNAP